MKKQRTKHDAISTFIGEDTRFDGTLRFEGAVRLDGRVDGAVVSRSGTLIVGDQATVCGDIAVSCAVLKGRVKGNVTAGREIDVRPPARIEGDLKAPVLMIASGVVFNGTCSMAIAEPETMPLEDAADQGASSAPENGSERDPQPPDKGPEEKSHREKRVKKNL